MSENPPGKGSMIRSLVDGEHHQRWIHLGDLLEDLRSQPDPSGALQSYADVLARYAQSLDHEAGLNNGLG